MEELREWLTIQQQDLELLECLGSSSTGEVHKGIWWNSFGEMLVAIKKMIVSDKEVIQEICKEFQTMQGISCEHLCKVYGGCLANNGEEIWMVMEYVEGGDLHSFLQKYEGTLSREIQLSFFVQTTKALVTLHNAPSPTLHKDIKSQNFLVYNSSPLSPLPSPRTNSPIPLSSSSSSSQRPSFSVPLSSSTLSPRSYSPTPLSSSLSPRASSPVPIPSPSSPRRPSFSTPLSSSAPLLSPRASPPSSSSSTLLLTDFGLSRAKAFLNSSTFTINAVRWMAPEIVATNKPQWSEKADIYSLGMVFYEIASRTMPYYEESNLGNILQKIKSGVEPKLPSDCPKEIADIICQCLRTKPSKRPTATELLKILERLTQPQEKKEDLRASLGLKKSAVLERREYRIVLVGAWGVGKTALAVRFVSNMFVQKYDPTIEENYKKQIEIEGRSYVLDIVDTSGQGEFSDLRDSNIMTGDGFVLVYSIADATTFEKIFQIRETIVQITGRHDMPIMLVGNKHKESQREVSTKEGKKTADKWGAGFIKASAKTGKNVPEIFTGVVRLIDKWRETRPHPRIQAPQNFGPPACLLL